MTREKQHQVDLIKSFVDLIHRYQRATNNSLTVGSPRYGVMRFGIPEFDLTIDRSFIWAWLDGGKSQPAKYEIEICSPDVSVLVQVTTPGDRWARWEDLPHSQMAKWSVDVVGDRSILSEVELWLKLNWPID